jgi:hypothetical protein
MLVYGVMALVTAGEITGVWRIVAVTSGASFILGIAASRLLLHIHSKLEVGIGLVIGAVALMTFSLGYLCCRGKEMRLLPLFIAMGVLVPLLHGRQLGAEEFLHSIASYFGIQCS